MRSSCLDRIDAIIINQIVPAYHSPGGTGNARTRPLMCPHLVLLRLVGEWPAIAITITQNESAVHSKIGRAHV